MKLILKIIIPTLLLSCASRDIKVSKFAKIDERDEYENNYISNKKKSIDKSAFFHFFFDNIFHPPKTKKFVSVGINKKIYEENFSLLTWSGHSTFLFQKKNINIIIDPQFSERASPFSFIGPKRYMPSILNSENLPRIDFVAVSHNHYDHLDIPSLRKLHKKFPDAYYLVPLGDKKLLEKNGIKNVIEFDWWQSLKIDDVEFTFTPVQHWSKRTMSDRNKSLWGGWWINIDDYKFLHLGDTGYTKDFIDIKNKLGKPDLVAIPIGAYKPRNIMKLSHLNPEEAVKTFIDLEADKAVSMHWGTFILSQENVDDPVINLKKEMLRFKIKEKDFLILKHGETISLDKLHSR
tara:strand:- start:523 stop:1566 length:1044 start_codon:yes stop_codon:yes gene_type:complete